MKDELGQLPVAFLLQYAIVRHLAGRGGSLEVATLDHLEISRAAVVAGMLECNHGEVCPLHSNPAALKQLARELLAIANTLAEAVKLSVPS